MKMKLAAVGESTPEEDRVYLQVLLPRNCGLTSKPMFFSKVCTVLVKMSLIDQCTSKYWVFPSLNAPWGGKGSHTFSGILLEISAFKMGKR